jgi:Family of unknown function (DUF6364)
MVTLIMRHRLVTPLALGNINYEAMPPRPHSLICTENVLHYYCATETEDFMQKNVTLKMDEQLLIKAKQKAIGSGKSLSQVVAEYLKKFCAPQSDYEKAGKQAIALMNKGFNLGGKPLTREEIYDRT